MSDDGLRSPKPDYGPREVIEIQLDAMKHNDDPFEDSGIETAFNFASQANKNATGPLPRFKNMVHNRRYEPLLDHDRVEFDELEKEDGKAMQEVVVFNGERTARYGFEVELQDKGSNEGCWMTNSVLRV